MGNSISGVILAGGQSRRFGGLPKQELTVRGESIISRQLKVFRDLFNEIIVVTNDLERFRNYSDIILASDVFRGLGPIGGIHASFKNASGTAVFVLAGDMPFPDKRIIEQQIAQYNNEACEVLLPVMDGLYEPLHAVYSTSLCSRLTSYLKAAKAPSVIGFCKQTGFSQFHPADIQAARVAFTNINTPADLGMLEGLQY